MPKFVGQQTLSFSFLLSKVLPWSRPKRSSNDKVVPTVLLVLPSDKVGIIDELSPKLLSHMSTELSTIFAQIP